MENIPIRLIDKKNWCLMSPLAVLQLYHVMPSMAAFPIRPIVYTY